MHMAELSSNQLSLFTKSALVSWQIAVTTMTVYSRATNDIQTLISLWRTVYSTCNTKFTSHEQRLCHSLKKYKSSYHFRPSPFQLHSSQFSILVIQVMVLNPPVNYHNLHNNYWSFVHQYFGMIVLFCLATNYDHLLKWFVIYLR